MPFVIKPIALIDVIMFAAVFSCFKLFYDENATAMFFLCTFLPFSKIIFVKVQPVFL